MATLPNNRRGGPGADPRVLRGWRETDVIEKLAGGVLTQEAIGELHGVSRSAIAQFARRHARRIAAHRDGLDQEAMGLWIADKVARVAEYQVDVEDCNALLADAREPGADADGNETPPDIDSVAKLQKGKHRALKSAAEELGQLPARVTLRTGGETTSLEISGVDLDQL